MVWGTKGDGSVVGHMFRKTPGKSLSGTTRRHKLDTLNLNAQYAGDFLLEGTWQA